MPAGMGLPSRPPPEARKRGQADGVYVDVHNLGAPFPRSYCPRSFVLCSGVVAPWISPDAPSALGFTSSKKKFSTGTGAASAFRHLQKRGRPSECYCSAKWGRQARRHPPPLYRQGSRCPSLPLASGLCQPSRAQPVNEDALAVLFTSALIYPGHACVGVAARFSPSGTQVLSSANAIDAQSAHWSLGALLGHHPARGDADPNLFGDAPLPLRLRCGVHWDAWPGCRRRPYLPHPGRARPFGAGIRGHPTLRGQRRPRHAHLRPYGDGAGCDVGVGADHPRHLRHLLLSLLLRREGADASLDLQR